MIQWSLEPKTFPRTGRNRRKQGQPKDGVRSRGKQVHAFHTKKRQKGVCFTHSEFLIRLHILSTKVPPTCISPSKSYRSSLHLNRNQKTWERRPFHYPGKVSSRQKSKDEGPRHKDTP